MPAGTQYTNGFLDSTDVRYNFAAGLEAGREQTWAADIGYLNTDSDKEIETYRWLGQVGQMREWVGGRQERVLNKYALDIRNKTYENTLPFAKNDLRRDKPGLLIPKAQEMGVRAITHWNTLASALIDTGTAGTNGLAYDGQFFYDTDHAESGTSQSNDLTATEIPSANVGTPAAPTAAEAANIISEAAGYILTLVDDQGEPINQDASGGLIVCSKYTVFTAFKAATSVTRFASGADNPLIGVTGNFRVIYAPRLTDGNDVRIFFDGGITDRPLILQEEQGIETQFLGEGSTEAFNNDRYVFGIRAVRGIGYGRWQRSLYIALS